MSTKIINAHILTVDDDFTVFANGQINIEDGIITYVGERDDSLRADESIDAGGKIVMPGFVNTHTHVVMTALRGYADDMALMDWLQSKIWPAEDKLGQSAVYYGTLLSMAELARGGVTAFCDSYYLYDWAVPAIEKSGIRGNIARSVVDFTPEMGETKFREMTELYEKYNGRGNITVSFAAHAQYTVTNQMLSRIGEAACEYGVPMQIHASETRDEHDKCVAEHGKTPIGLLHSLGATRAKIIAAHCCYATEEDMDIMAEYGVCVASCPQSNLKLASGIAPLERFRKKGIGVSLGTDGASSNNNLSMWEEMTLASLLQKGMSGDPTAMNAADSIRLATAWGADTIGINSGRIEKGRNADLIMIDASGVRYAPRFDNTASAVVYAGSDADVCMTMVGGKVIYRDGSILFADEEELIKKAQEFADKLK